MVAATDPAASFQRGRLPDGFERWTVVVPRGARRRTSAAEWRGAIVLIERGTVEVGCLMGGRATFVAGDLLALGWLPLKWIRNAGSDEVRIVAVRRSPLASGR